MVKRSDKSARASILLQLTQALDQYREQASQAEKEKEEKFIDASFSDVDDAAAWTLLQSKQEKRQLLRFQELFPVVYSSSPGLKPRASSKAAIPEKKIELADWFREVAESRDQVLNTSSRMQMTIHLQAIREELIYFISFNAVQSSKDLPATTRKTDISGSGMDFPTIIAHRRGEILFVVLFLPTTPFTPLKLVAEVVRSSVKYPKEGYRTAIKFIDISPQDQQRIMGFISRRKRQQRLKKAYRLDS